MVLDNTAAISCVPAEGWFMKMALRSRLTTCSLPEFEYM